MAAMLLDLVNVEYVGYLTRLTKSHDPHLAERAHTALTRIATADLEKVGPKGYIHGWIFVGAPGVGSRVYHPHHGHGTVTRHGKRTVGVRFDSGKEHAFEHSGAADSRHVGATSGHFAERVHARTGKPVARHDEAAKPETPPGEAKPTEGSYEHLLTAASDEGKLREAVHGLTDEQIQAHIEHERNLPPGEKVTNYNSHSAVHNALVAERKQRRAAAKKTTPPPTPSTPDHLNRAGTAIAEGRHADAVNHLTAAAGEAPDKKTRDQITELRNHLAAQVMGKPAPKPRTRRGRAQVRPQFIPAGPGLEGPVEGTGSGYDRAMAEYHQLMAEGKWAEASHALDRAHRLAVGGPSGLSRSSLQDSLERARHQLTTAPSRSGTPHKPKRHLALAAQHTAAAQSKDASSA